MFPLEFSGTCKNKCLNKQKQPREAVRENVYNVL